MLAGVMQGDKALFTSWDETEESWKVIDPILKCIKKIKKISYASGSSGPKQADKLLEGKSWIVSKEVLK
jgi:glucose-6-phosphate 1-dehydrogenase